MVKGTDWIYLAQGRDQWWVINSSVTCSGISSSSQIIINFPKTNYVHKVPPNHSA